MKTDRELLELAAKAYWGEEIGDICSIEWSEADQAIAYTHGENQDHNGRDCTFIWNPLADDGEALRLAVKMDRESKADFLSRVIALRCVLDFIDAPYTTTRRAIVRAAAEIGESMP